MTILIDPQKTNDESLQPKAGLDTLVLALTIK